MLQLKGGVPNTTYTLLKPAPLHRVNLKPSSPTVLVSWRGCAHIIIPKPKMQVLLSPPQLRAEGVWCFPVPWEAGILPHQHILKGTTGSAAPAARSPQLNDGKHLGVGRGRAHNTFLVLLHDRGRRRSDFHGEAIGSPEGVAVSDDESPRLPVLQQGNGCRREWQSSEMAW